MDKFLNFFYKHPILGSILLIFVFFVFLSIISPSTPPIKKNNKLASTPTTSLLIATTSSMDIQTSTPATSVQPSAIKKIDLSVSPSSTEKTYKVTKVVDGDTLDILDGSKTIRLRLIGIDTPETVDPRKPVQCFGIEASNKAKELLLNKQISLEFDPSQGTLDKYGRTLAYVFLPDGTHYNKWMILNGYAHEYTYNLPYKYQNQFKAAERTARANLSGLWNPNICNGDTITATSNSTVVNSEPTSSAQPAIISGHIFYTSSHYRATYYYCDTDDGWKALSSSYLKSFSSEAELLAKYKRTLHEPCK